MDSRSTRLDDDNVLFDNACCSIDDACSVDGDSCCGIGGLELAVVLLPWEGKYDNTVFIVFTSVCKSSLRDWSACLNLSGSSTKLVNADVIDPNGDDGPVFEGENEDLKRVWDVCCCCFWLSVVVPFSPFRTSVFNKFSI